LTWRIPEDSGDSETTTAINKESALASRKKPAGVVTGSLHPKYTFENFVVGKANEFAHAACSAISKNLGSKYNPLFIYGGGGVGKNPLFPGTGPKKMWEKCC